MSVFVIGFNVIRSFNICTQCSLRFDFDFFPSFTPNIYSVRKINEMSNGMRVYCWRVIAIKATMRVLNHMKFPKKCTQIQMSLHTSK